MKKALATLLSAVSLAVAAQTAPSIQVSNTKDWLQVGNPLDAYWIENNPWGQGPLTEGTASNQYEQRIGRGTTVGPNGEVAFRTNWRWPQGTTEVKGYPSILYGRKPGYYSTGNLVNGLPVRLPDGSISQTAPSGHTPGTILPIQLPLKSLKSKFAYQHNATPTGQGQLTYDIWLQSNPKQDAGWGNASITHEIMIPLANWGNYGSHAGGRNPSWYDHTATIGGRLYHVYATKGSDGCLRYNFGGLNGNYGKTGWKMIAFVPDQMPVAAGEIDLAAIINYLATRRDACGQPWGLGNEYVSSVELGVEPVVGTGDITVHNFKVWADDSVIAPAPTPVPAPAPAPAPAPSPTPAPTTCSYSEWVGTKRYFPGETVTRLGKLYVATALSATVWNENSPPEWTPTLWSLTTCMSTTPAPAPAPTPAPSCPVAANWKNGVLYTSGNIVSYNGQRYIARGVNFRNIRPTDARYWSKYFC